MAKFNIVYDTNDKTMVVTLDGKKVGNVSNVMIDSYGDEAHIQICSVENDEDNSMSERHVIYSSADRVIPVDKIIPNKKSQSPEEEIESMDTASISENIAKSFRLI